MPAWKWLLCCLALFLTACVNGYKLPAQENITHFAIKEGKAIAQSENFAYVFYLPTPEDRQYYLSYQTFLENYLTKTGRQELYFDVIDNQVKARIEMSFDSNQLNEGDIEALTKNYKARRNSFNKELTVAFTFNGQVLKLSKHKNLALEPQYQLGRPIALKIMQQRSLSAVGEGLVILASPLLPFVMMYGCATGPC